MIAQKLGAAAGAALLVFMAAANSEVIEYQITVTFGDTSSDGLDVGTGGDVSVGTFIVADGTWPQGNIDSSGDKGWTSSGTNTLADITPPGFLFLADISGANSTSYYNPYDQTVDALKDYTAADAPNCTTSAIVTPYSCSQIEGKSTKVRPVPIEGVGPSPSATGLVSVDTVAGTLTGTLTFNDRGDGSAYALRSGDGSPFNASRNLYSTSATLALNLTGTFTPTSWDVTGGTGTITDAGYQCTPGDLSGTLCNTSAVIGGHQPDGSHASWINVPVYDKIESDLTRVLITTIPGVVMTVALDGSGTITSGTGEGHKALGSAGSGCPTSVVYDAALTKMSCGGITAVSLSITGGVPPPDDQPVANDDSATTLPETQVDVSVLANDTGLTNTPVTVTITTPPSAGNASVAANVISYTPNAGTQNDTLVYTVTDDDGDSDTATLSITVDDEPAAVDDSAEALINDDVDIPVLANDTGLTDTPVVVTIESAPASGSTAIVGNVITYTAGGTAGTVTFDYRVTDDDGDFSVATVTVDVTDIPPDTQPAAFDFTDQFNVPLNTLVTSNTVTITGINQAASISVAGGEYSIGCTASFTAAPGTVDDGDTVCVRHTSASTRGTAVTTTLTVGSPAVSAAFSSSTPPVTRSGSSSADGLILALLGLVALVRRRRFA